MGVFNRFFDSNVFRTLKAYTIFLTFLNVPYLLTGVLEKSKLVIGSVFRGSNLMFSVQADILRMIIDWIGVLLGEKAWSAAIEKTLTKTFSGDTATGIFVIGAIMMTVIIMHLVIKLFGRFIPALSGLHAHHRSTPWSMLYLILFILYIFYFPY